jgi:hypothetical protein
MENPAAQLTQMPGVNWLMQFTSKGQATFISFQTKYPAKAETTSPSALERATKREEATAAPLTKVNPEAAARQTPPA